MTPKTGECSFPIQDGPTASPKADDLLVQDRIPDTYCLHRTHGDRTSAQGRGQVTGGKAMGIPCFGA